MRDRMWTGPIVAGALLLICGIVIGAIATDHNQGSTLDAYMDGREAEAYRSALVVCRERASYLERLRPDVTDAYSEVGRE